MQFLISTFGNPGFQIPMFEPLPVIAPPPQMTVLPGKPILYANGVAQLSGRPDMKVFANNTGPHGGTAAPMAGSGRTTLSPDSRVAVTNAVNALRFIFSSGLSADCYTPLSPHAP